MLNSCRGEWKEKPLRLGHAHSLLQRAHNFRLLSYVLKGVLLYPLFALPLTLKFADGKCCCPLADASTEPDRWSVVAQTASASYQQLHPPGVGDTQQTIMGTKLPPRVNAPFLHAKIVPDSDASIGTSSPDFLTRNLSTQSLWRKRFSSFEPRQTPAGASNIPYTYTVTSSLNDAKIAGTSAPKQLGDACPLPHSRICAIQLVVTPEWENSDSTSTAMVVIQTDITSECSRREQPCTTHAQRTHNALHAYPRASTS